MKLNKLYLLSERVVTSLLEPSTGALLLLRSNAMTGRAPELLLLLLLLLLLFLSQLNTVDGHVGKIDYDRGGNDVMVHVQVDVLLMMVVVLMGNGRRWIADRQCEHCCRLVVVWAGGHGGGGRCCCCWVT